MKYNLPNALTLARIAAVLKEQGTLALTFQPRRRGATRADALRTGERLGQALRAAGFVAVRSEVLEMLPVPAVCVIGVKPAASDPAPGR